jgi:DNA (cytosine-5)-methyltransferase 1
VQSKRPTVVDLFCGAGGLSYGFELAGFDVVAAVDFDPIAAATYRQRNPEIPFFEADIATITGRALADAAGRDIDVVIGGPSCQGFSTHGKRDPNDPRNFLFKHFVRIVNELRPLFVVMENVRGLLTYDKGHYRQEIHAAFANIGYRIDSRVLRAVEYGVPQLRERVFFIATRTNAQIAFPAPTHCPPEEVVLTGLQPYVTVRDALGDLFAIGEEGEETRYAAPPQTDFQRYVRKATKASTLTLHRARRVSDLAYSIINKIPPGRGLRAIPPNQLPERFKRMRTISTGALRRDCTTLYHRLSWDKPAYTITCYFNNVSSGPFVHPEENRALTPREGARLQSFPDDYVFVDKQLYRQIGNAVPPLLAAAVAKRVRISLRESLRDSALPVAV